MCRRNDFTTYVLKFPPAKPFLPLTHVTDAFHFRDILKNLQLAPIQCRVFKENLLYFFYGRPAYRVNSGIRSCFNSNYPIVILLKPHSIRQAKRIFPFDSGAYEDGLFKPYMNKNFNRDSFLVNPNSAAQRLIPLPKVLAQIVSAFFETNSNYYYAINPKEMPKKDSQLQFEMESYCELINSKINSVFDDRRSSIEIQVIETIDLDSETVFAVVLPQSFLENDRIKEIVIKEWKAKIISYPSYRNEPDFLIPIIIDRLGAFFSKEGII